MHVLSARAHDWPRIRVGNGRRRHHMSMLRNNADTKAQGARGACALRADLLCKVASGCAHLLANLNEEVYTCIQLAGSMGLVTVVIIVHRRQLAIK